MLVEVFKEAWAALGRNRVRSLLTMTGISWGIMAVTLLLSYGSGFRSVLLYTFEVFGKAAVICWPGTTSEQAGGERAGKEVRFEQEDAEWVKAQSPLIKRVTLETVKFKGISHDERLSDSATRGVYPEYGEMRNEVPSEGRWITAEDVEERRIVPRPLARSSFPARKSRRLSQKTQRYTEERSATPIHSSEAA
jgi:putative ABC transport system permease protein